MSGHEYNAQTIEEVFPFVFETPTIGGVSKREPGMPSGGGDPRNATMLSTVVADVKWAWRTCEWITEKQAKVLVATALPYPDGALAEILDMSTSTFSHNKQVGFREMANWLNATPEQRAARHIDP